jgi:hypothetical protein
VLLSGCCHLGVLSSGGVVIWGCCHLGVPVLSSGGVVIWGCCHLGVLSDGMLSSGMLSSGMLSSGMLSSGVLSSEVTQSPFHLFIENFIHFYKGKITIDSHQQILDFLKPYLPVWRKMLELHLVAYF